jgi:hypothetical protein
MNNYGKKTPTKGKCPSKKQNDIEIFYFSICIFPAKVIMPVGFYLLLHEDGEILDKPIVNQE